MVKAQIRVERLGKMVIKRFATWRDFSGWLWRLKGGRWGRFYETAPTGSSHLVEARTPRGVRVEIWAKEV